MKYNYIERRPETAIILTVPYAYKPQSLKSS